MRITRKRRIWATSRLTKIVGSVIDFCLGYPEIGVAKSPPLSRLGPCIAQACRAPVASDGVAGAKRGVVVGGKPSFDYVASMRGCRLDHRLAGPAC